MRILKNKDMDELARNVGKRDARKTTVRPSDEHVHSCNNTSWRTLCVRGSIYRFQP
jgi:hypothetical protein